MKKSLACLTASILAIASLPVSAGAAEFDPFPLGDVDRDTVITGHDAALVSRYVLLGDNRLTDKQLKLADINQDGVVDQTDADLIHQQAVYLLGDVQLNGDLRMDDAFDTLQEVAYAATFLYHDGSTTPKFSKLQENLADITGLQDGAPDMDDAMTILQYVCLDMAGALSTPQAPYESGIFYLTKDGAPCYFFDPADYIQNGPGKGF